MSVAFDTLKFVMRLQSGGFSPEQARAAAEAFAEATSQELVTKTDLAAAVAELKAGDAALQSDLKADHAALRSELKAEHAALRTELRTELAALRTELKTEHAALRTDLKADNAAMRTDLERQIAANSHAIEVLKRDLTIRLGGMLVAAVGVLLAAMRFMMVPH